MRLARKSNRSKRKKCKSIGRDALPAKRRLVFWEWNASAVKYFATLTGCQKSTNAVLISKQRA